MLKINANLQLKNLITTNLKKVPTLHECHVINLIIIKKEAPTAGFKTSEHLCLPQIGR